MKKTLIIQGHPNPNSYCAALAIAYVNGAGGLSDNLRLLEIHKLDFDPVLHESKALKQPLEPDLINAQEWLKWADRWVLIYPTWWGTSPGLLKGFFDRILTQGFGFSYEPDQILWKKLLKGRTAHIITTMNTPPWFYRLVYHDGGIHVMAKCTLGFCGIKTTRITRIGPIRHFSEGKRLAWLEKVRLMGQQS